MVRPLTADLLALLNNPIAIYRDGLRWVVLPHDAHDVARACQQSYDEWSGPLILSDKITQRSLQLLLMKETGRNIVLVLN